MKIINIYTRNGWYYFTDEEEYTLMIDTAKDFHEFAMATTSVKYLNPVNILDIAFDVEIKETLHRVANGKGLKPFIKKWAYELLQELI